MGAYRFSMAPNISVPRSLFKMPFNHSTSFDHGKLVPIDCFEILPGDEFKCNFSALIRMSTPIAPIMSNIKAHVHVFFVPMRLVWEHTKEFYGENKTSAGYQTYNYTIPNADYNAQTNEKSVSAYLGKPVTSINSGVDVSVLKERGYFLIWNEYYRAQQLQNPVLITLGDSGTIGTITQGHGMVEGQGSNITIDFSTNCMNVCKQFDYFTAATTAPQYGTSVTLPLGSTAPIIPTPGNNLAGRVSWTPVGVAGNPSFVLEGASGTNSNVSLDNTVTAITASTELRVKSANLVADLSNATAASINSIRYAFQVQKWLERANFGSRFFEMLNLHYGVTSPDARLQRPEYLGGCEFYINVDQVVATANGVDDSSISSNLGQTGAVSVTGVKNKNLFNKAFVEPGYVYVLISTTQERLYSQGLLREDTRFDRFDFYFPEFANLGDQAVKNKEIMLTGSNDDAEFGFQEHWAEYRYRANRVSGILNPNVANSLDYWTLAEKVSFLSLRNAKAEQVTNTT